MSEFEGRNLTDLLEGKVAKVSSQPDLSVLGEADKYDIDLSSLEAVSVKKGGSKSAGGKSQVMQQNENWTKLDVKLLDIANLVFERVDFPVFIVQDDEIVYANNVVSDLLRINDGFEVVKHKFFEFVYKDDWNLLANNIGEMLTNHTDLTIRFNRRDNKIQELNLKAVYLPDIEHFSFVLLGEKVRNKNKPSSNVLYDDDTGLPSFFLFEDRLQMSVLMSNATREGEHKYGIAVLAINIDNIKEFKKLNLDDAVVKKLADNLVFNLPKTVTVSKGLKYHFWILLSGMRDDFEIDYHIRRIKEVLDAGISDNFMRHDLVYSAGCSIFSKDARSSKELIEHTIESVRKAQENAESSLIIYGQK